MIKGVARPKDLEGGMGMAGVEGRHRRIVDRHPGVAPPRRDVGLAVGLEPLGASECRVRAHGILHLDVVATEPVPGRGILILASGLDRLRERAVGVAQVLLAILIESPARGALDIKKPGIHQEVAGMELTGWFHETPLRSRPTHQQRRRQDHSTDSHVRTPWFAPRGARRRAERRAPPRAAGAPGPPPPPRHRRISGSTRARPPPAAPAPSPPPPPPERGGRAPAAPP